MSEDFLQYLWKHKKFAITSLKTTNNQIVVLQCVGVHNTKNSGPDFFNARISIDGQKWAGNVEVHYKSSDWYLHNHENDCSYDNVILHVVWEDDTEIFRKDNTVIPTLQLKDYILPSTLIKYKAFFVSENKKWINCETQLSEVSSFVLSNWQERLYIERLEEKTTLILKLLRDSSNNWEAVLFKLLAKGFGLKNNGDAFLSIANSLDFSIIQKCSKNLDTLEALFFGQADLLRFDDENLYFKKLQEEYVFLKNKFRINNKGVIPVQFFRLRPSNFPTIRLAQLAGLYHEHQHLFGRVMNTNDVEGFYEIFNGNTSVFWDTHYTFKNETTSRKKNVTKSFVDLILINTIVPLRFVYAKSTGKDPEEEVFDLLGQLSPEKNSIITNFTALKMPVSNAMHSQAMLQLKNNYCNKNACLKCAIGNYLLNQD